MTERSTLTVAVAIVGGGPAGLTAARELAARTPGEVLVLEQDTEPGGVPRHSHHLGYGVRDLYQLRTGAAYARNLATAARLAGAVIRTAARVTGWAGDRSLDVTTPQGLLRVDARAVVLATGARERPRAARLVPGTRPVGVYTTGQLQDLVHRHRRFVGSHAVVVGAEPVSWAAVWTLREAGARTVLMTSTHSGSYPALAAVGRSLLRTPVATRHDVTRILGERTVAGVEIADRDTGATRVVDCDCVVFTGDWVPEHELARAARLDLDGGNRVPLVDTALRTSRDGVFAVGDLLHPGGSAGSAALDGRRVADSVTTWLDGEQPAQQAVRLTVDAPLRSVAPALLRRADPLPADGRLLLWTDEPLARPTLVVRQDGTDLAAYRLRWSAAPGRALRVPTRLLRAVDPRGGAVRLSLR